MSGVEKAVFGAIVSFENALGKTFVCHCKGGVTKAVREACEIALGHDETFRVVAISTPQSIYTDLQGIRFRGHRHDEIFPTAQLALPELGLLSRAGMRDLLHPRLQA